MGGFFFNVLRQHSVTTRLGRQMVVVVVVVLMVMLVVVVVMVVLVVSLTSVLGGPDVWFLTWPPPLLPPL